MRIVLQRVTRASVSVDGQIVGSIGSGLLALVGVGVDDDAATADALAAKTAALRIFDTPEGARSVADIGGGVLVISQFTLLADTRRGNRPSWSAAAPAPIAEPLVARYAQHLAAAGIQVQTGSFGAHMAVDLINDGPVTIVLDR